MPWQIKSMTGYVSSIEAFRVGVTQGDHPIQYYFRVTVVDNPSDPGSSMWFTLPVSDGNSVVHHATIISILKDALCSGKKVIVKGEAPSEDEYIDRGEREYRRRMGYPHITEVGISA